MRRSVVLAVLTIAILLGGLAVVFGPDLLSRQGTARIGGPFTLSDGGGHVVTDQTFRGRWMLVYFGYTHCPDVCPTTLTTLTQALDALGQEHAAHVAPVFITVDPERDTPEVVRDYVHAFDPRITGLSGTAAQVADAERAYRVYAARHPTKDGGYEMDHSSVIYVMGPDGDFVTVLGDDSKPQDIATKLRGLGA
ncbi:MAG TPA: SCO family protein [Acetobacteraceae bacterium]|nr:SCO family protein [Acetobacteraceae bacterium]